MIDARLEAFDGRPDLVTDAADTAAHSVTVEAAAADDLAVIAAIHVAAWRSAYRGLLPEAHLDGLDVGERLDRWRRIFAAIEETAGGLLVARGADGVVGFLSFGSSRDPRWPDRGEIYAVYLDDRHRRRGIGRALFEAASAMLASRGSGDLFLWVLETNAAAIGAYRRWGGRPEPSIRTTARIGDAEFAEIAVFFPAHAGSPGR